MAKYVFSFDPLPPFEVVEVTKKPLFSFDPLPPFEVVEVTKNPPRSKAPTLPLVPTKKTFPSLPLLSPGFTTSPSIHPPNQPLALLQSNPGRHSRITTSSETTVYPNMHPLNNPSFFSNRKPEPACRIGGGGMKEIFEFLSPTVHRDTVSAPPLDTISKPLPENLARDPYALKPSLQTQLQTLGTDVRSYEFKHHPHPAHKAIETHLPHAILTPEPVEPTPSKSSILLPSGEIPVDTSPPPPLPEPSPAPEVEPVIPETPPPFQIEKGRTQPDDPHPTHKAIETHLLHAILTPEPVEPTPSNSAILLPSGEIPVDTSPPPPLPEPSSAPEAKPVIPKTLPPFQIEKGRTQPDDSFLAPKSPATGFQAHAGTPLELPLTATPSPLETSDTESASPKDDLSPAPKSPATGFQAYAGLETSDIESASPKPEPAPVYSAIAISSLPPAPVPVDSDLQSSHEPSDSAILLPSGEIPVDTSPPPPLPEPSPAPETKPVIPETLPPFQIKKGRTQPDDLSLAPKSPATGLQACAGTPRELPLTTTPSSLETSDTESASAKPKPAPVHSAVTIPSLPPAPVPVVDPDLQISHEPPRDLATLLPSGGLRPTLFQERSGILSTESPTLQTDPDEVTKGNLAADGSVCDPIANLCDLYQPPWCEGSGLFPCTRRTATPCATPLPKSNLCLLDSFSEALPVPTSVLWDASCSLLPDSFLRTDQAEKHGLSSEHLHAVAHLYNLRVVVLVIRGIIRLSGPSGAKFHA